MKKQKNILRFSGLVLIFSVLFTHVFSRGFMGETQVGHPLAASAQQEEKQSVNHDKTTDESEQEEQASVSQLTFEVVVPSYAFDFGVPFVTFFNPGFEFLSEEELLPNVSDPILIDSYFEKLFEHHIAINAP